MNNITVGFIGFGLIGGSIAKAIREEYSGYKIIAFNYYSPKSNTSLELALEEKVLDEVCTELDGTFSTCDLIFLCAPVLTNIEYLSKLKHIIKPTCILTDVGSVKGNIYHEVKNLDMEHHFIGGHPMAGSEKVGYSNSNAKLLENAYYVLTPAPLVSQDQINTLYNLVEQIGGIPVILDAKEHDDTVAAISHVPHIIAASLVHLIRNSDDKEGKMRALAAGGFRDITRIASSSPIMWQNICLTNSTSIKEFLDQYIQLLQQMSHTLSVDNNNKDVEEYLYEFFDIAKDYRDSLPTASIGILDRVHEVYLDIIDEAGAIATIATILASNHISIRNIGIIHNREFQDGVLRIEFYDKKASIQAVDLLGKYSYTIYER